MRHHDVYVACPIPICGKRVSVTVSEGERPITSGPSDSWYPGSPPELQEYVPTCECEQYPVVDEEAYAEAVFKAAEEKISRQPWGIDE